MNIYLVRHGDDDERYRGGWSQLPLIEEGIEKSKKLADFLVGPQDECIKYINEHYDFAERQLKYCGSMI